MQMYTIVNIIRNRNFAGSDDASLLVCGMYWCLSDTKRMCGEVKP